MDRNISLILIALLFIFLVGFRSIANRLFYDPFLHYFDHDYLSEPIPNYNSYKLLFHLFLRYLINTLASLGIVWIAFKDKNLLQFSVKFYVIAFLFLTFAYFTILNGELKDGYLFVFYVRRFLIHPLLLIILLPAFYYKRGKLSI
ncbi:MAG: exosortase F system-associated protein [Lutimonas sp.]